MAAFAYVATGTPKVPIRNSLPARVILKTGAWPEFVVVVVMCTHFSKICGLTTKMLFIDHCV